MTSHKSFKKLVRERMQKTGESYTTARRQIIHGSREKAESSIDRRALPPSAVSHLAGSVAGSTALRVLLAHAGIRGSDGGVLSEAMCFGLAGGIGIGVFQFHYEKEDFASFFLAGRHSWHDDLPYLKNALESFGLEVFVAETGGAKAAEKNLRTALDGGKPCVAWVDAAELPHRAMPKAASGGGYHIVTVYGIDEERGCAWIGDCSDDPVELELEALARARARIKKYKNRVLSLRSLDGERVLDGDAMRSLVQGGVDRCVQQLAKPALKSSAKNFKIDAIDAWAQRLHGSSAKDSWESVFTLGAKLWGGLTSIYEYTEHYGTGGGLCRPLMAEFLDEASTLLGDPALGEVAARYRALGESWAGLARVALPDTWADTKTARVLIARKAELQHDAADPDELRQIWRDLHELGEKVRGTFPLTAKEADGLRADLKSQALSIHASEVAAIAALQDCLR